MLPELLPVCLPEVEDRPDGWLLRVVITCLELRDHDEMVAADVAAYDGLIVLE